ncbi:MAG: transcriptional regulator [Bacteroidota bacterium]|nr:transcriptional regulator [Bacteroidota bacterium]MDX5404008.1 transcriptional regulator [Bacteroidota bacterium]MDX5427964.1 transcriptional regulator [Bacteroidota bacterium]MDX5505810.1 transcriptional regulator [Bacteroidota bacterium]
MKALKRVEIIVSKSETEKIVNILTEVGADGYTIIDHIRGMGNRGIQDGFGLTDAFSNVMIYWVCEEEILEKAVDPLRKILTKAGGVCFVSDGKWLIH